MRTLALILPLLLLRVPAAQAHGGAADESYLAWTFDPWIVAPLVLAAAVYTAGTWTLWRRARMAHLRAWRAFAYAAGWLSLAAALVSPLHWLGERIFTVHMIEHEIVMAVAAPLMVLSRPIGILMWGLPAGARAAVAALAQHPVVRTAWRHASSGANATLLHGLAIWLWHVPAWFDAAVNDVAVHRLQHASFFATAVVFWWSVLRRGEYGSGAWHLFITMLHTSALGALMALSPRVLYSLQTLHSGEWGLTPLQDQQLAGIVMWVPAGTVYAGAALWLLAVWIRRSSGDRSHACETF